MRVLLLNQFYPPDPAPTGVVLRDLARGLAARGHEVAVCCSDRAYLGGRVGPGGRGEDGVDVRRLPGLGFGRTSLARLASYAAFAGQVALRAGLAGPRPDVVVCLTTPPFLGLVGRGLSVLRGTRHAHWVMDLYPDALVADGMLGKGGLAHRALRGLARWQLRGACLVVTLGPVMEQALCAHADGRVEQVPLWSDEVAEVPPDEIATLRHGRGWPDGELVLLWSGNLGRGHLFGDFLEAARRLGPAGPRWVFQGAGNRRRELEAFAGREPAARVELLPYVPLAHLRPSLAGGDVHLLGLREAWQGLLVPSKLQAAFGVGRPVIFVGRRENEAARWVEESGGGWVVPPGDLDRLLAAVSEAAVPAERCRRGRAALDFARRRFDRSANCGRLARMLEAAAGAVRPSAGCR